MLFLLPILMFFQEPSIPFRAKEDFLVELKYELRQKPQDNTLAYDADRGVAPKTSSGPLPYLIVNVTILNRKEEEVRIRCVNNVNTTLFNKKADKNTVFKLEMGYIDDMKDRISPHQFRVMAMSEDKNPLNQIELVVMEDGTFLVNGEKRGKF